MNANEYERIEGWYSTFVARYPGETPDDRRNYDLKREHTLRVVSIMDRLSGAERLGEGDPLILRTVALCHDVGRFPQYARYRTFNDDASCNHAAMAVSVLRHEGALSFLPPEEESLILQGVAFHNRFEIPPSLPHRVADIVRFIRDADKLDIWRVMIEYFTAPACRRASAVVWELPDTGRCSPEVIGEVAGGRVVNRKLLRTVDDFKLLQLSWVYDLSFPSSYRLLKEFGYVESLSELLSHDPAAAPAVAAVEAYRKQRSM